MKYLKTVLALSVLASGTCFAQSSEELVIKPKGGGVEIVAKNRLIGETWTVSLPFDFTVTCESVDCKQVAIETAGEQALGQSAGTNGRQFQVSKLPDGGAGVTVLLKGRKLATLELVPDLKPLARQGDTPPDNESAPTLQELLICKPKASQINPTEPVYDAADNSALFVTNVLGTVLGGPERKDGDVIDEDDTVFVRVLVHPDLYPYLRVTRTSDTRTLGTLNIAGQGSTLETHSDTGEASRKIPTCAEFNARLTDFKAGTGKVRIGAQIGEDDKELGKFEFAVSPIYHGILSFGPFSSDVVNDSFKLVDSGGQNIVAPGEEGDQETNYAVWYTHFVWGGRDLEKKPHRWYHRINPSIGLVTNHLEDHALVGVSIDLGAFVFVVGSHFARTTVLSKSSGLAVGDVFAGEADAIPTAKKWESSAYFGVSVDLRAAGALIKAAFSGGT